MNWLAWSMIGLALSPIWGALLIEVWQGSVKPRLIPRADLDRVAGDLVAQYRDSAGEVALRNEHRAWRDCDTFEQARWRRVRRIIGRRQSAKERYDTDMAAT